MSQFDENFDVGCFGQAVKVEGGTINLLSLNQSSVEIDTTGLVSYLSSISRDTTEHWEGLPA